MSNTKAYIFTCLDMSKHIQKVYKRHFYLAKPNKRYLCQAESMFEQIINKVEGCCS